MQDENGDESDGGVWNEEEDEGEEEEGSYGRYASRY